MSNVADIPLPYGWVAELDQRTNHPYYVDTKANPARSIWVHPYEDEQYLSEHPDVRDKVGRSWPDESDVKDQTSKPPERGRRHSFHGESSSSNIAPDSREPTSQPGSPTSRDHKKRGFLGHLKRLAVGGFEARNDMAMQRGLLMQQRRQAFFRYPQRGGNDYNTYGPPDSDRYGYGGYNAYGPPDGRRGYNSYGPPNGNLYGRNAYGPPVGDPYGYGEYPRNRRGGGGSLAMPLLGGLAGGLLLDEIIDLDGGGFL